MSQLDVVASLLRSSARGAAAKLRELPLAQALERLLQNAGLGRSLISDAQLTKAVAQCVGVSAATVSAARDWLRVDVAREDGAHVATRVRLASSVFAPGGAKELAFDVDPREAARLTGCREAVAAIAAEIARALWRPALTRAPESGPAAFVAEEEGRLIVDLRTVPEVRWALRQRLPAAMIELLRPRSLAITERGVALQLAFDARLR